MAVVRFLHILSVVSLAVLHASFDALPVNALALERGHVARGLGHVHADIAKRRDSSPTCRPRPTSASPKAATPAPSVPSSSSSSQPASSTTSSQPPATNTPSSPSGSTSKILLAYNNHEYDFFKNFVTGLTHATFNWALDAPSKDVLGPSYEIYNTLEFIPSIGNAAGAPKLSAAVGAKKPRHIRGFNEPEISGQASMSVSEAHSLWMQYVAYFAKDGIQLLAPAVTTGSAGLDWLDAFMTMCAGECGISLIDLHFYVLDPVQVTSVLTDVHGKYSLNIWITECGCMDYSGKNQPCPQGTFNTLYSTVMSFVKDTEWIEKIAWFGMFTADELPNNVYPTNAMIKCTGDSCVPNALGAAFINGSTTPY